MNRGHVAESRPSARPAAESRRPPPLVRRATDRLLRAVWNLLALGMLLQIVLVCTPLTEALYLWLSVSGPPVKSDAIICLGGDLDRIIWAAELYHAGYAPVVIVTNKPGAAHKMARAMTQCGVPPNDVRIDHTSHTTGDHPGGVAALPGIDPARQLFLIVTDHQHSRRAAAVFRKGGFRYFSVYSDRIPFLETDDDSKTWRWRVRILPQLAYEYTALIKYWLEGRI